MPKTQNSHELIKEFVRTQGFELKMLEQKVFSLWRQYLGTPIGTKTMPVSISGGILKVYTEYPPYKKHLLLLKERIIADLNAKLGQPILRDLRIDVRQFLTSTPSHTTSTPTETEASDTIPETSPASTTHEPTSETLEQIEQMIADVTDTDLKTSLHQLFVSQSIK